jgi:hypothetical protein
VLALFALAIAFRPPPTPGPYARDFEAYYSAGRTWDDGSDPYSRLIWRTERLIDGVVATRDELLPFVGPPPVLALFGALAHLPQPAAVRVWGTILAAALGGLVFAAFALARAPRDPLLLAAAVAFTALSGPAFSDLALGQSALLSVAAIALALVAFERRSTSGAAAALLVAAVQPNLVVALAARVRSAREIGIAFGAAVAFFAIGVACLGPAAWTDYLALLTRHGAAEATILIQHTPAAIAYGLGLAPDAAHVTGIVVAAVAALLAGGAIVGARLAGLDATLVALGALPLAVPFFHEHDFVVLIVPALVLAYRARGAALALASCASVLGLVDWLGFAQRVPQQTQNACLAAAVALAFVLLAGMRRAAFAGPLLLAVLLAVFIPLARAHPAPTWPDTLALTYHAPVALDASGVWEDEQRTAGLEQRDPVWALLRTLPLAGSALFAVAVLLPAGGAERRSRKATRAATDSG